MSGSFSAHSRAVGVGAKVLGEIGDPSEREAICENVHLIDQGEAGLHLRGRATRLKIKRLRRYWFETGIPMVIELDQPAHREW